MHRNTSHYIIISTLILLGLSVYIITKNPTSNITHIPPENLQQLRMQENAQVIDVRTPGEFESGHIEKALNIDWENRTEFEQEIATLPKDSTYILYCRSGRRSSEAAKYMNSQGFAHVYNVLGGTSSGKLDLTTSLQTENSKMTVEEALKTALTDELHAKAFYTEVLKVYPGAQPFSNIIQAEQKHIDALLALHEKYGLNPALETKAIDVWTGTKTEACKLGVQAEIENAKLYREKLLPAVSDNSDIEVVFTNLMNASERNHLPAFNRCS